MHQPRPQRAHQRRHRLGQPTSTTDPRFVVPPQLVRHRSEAAREQLPHPGHQVHGLARGQHHRGDEPGERRHHHQHRQHRLLAEPNPDLRRREPQVALDHPTRRMLEAVDRIGGQVLRADRPDPLPEPGDRAGPPDPLGDHRRRHRGIGRQQRPNPRLHLVDRRRRRGPLVLRRTITGHRTGHRVSRDAQLPRDSPLRQPLAAVKMPDQGPVFQGDHPSNLIGWPTFQPSRLAGFSTVVNMLRDRDLWVMSQRSRRLTSSPRLELAGHDRSGVHAITLRSTPAPSLRPVSFHKSVHNDGNNRPSLQARTMSCGDDSAPSPGVAVT